ncbi:MAG: ParA family protein [Lachnospiraceae bacterium]|nr:ParA family protein [Lachnospiraceae bacterium]
MTKEYGKIIFVNSYKGGAGKTTLSMMHCIDDLFNTQKYNNVIYMDLDILGTGTCYLFDETKLPEGKSFEVTGEAVPIELTKGAESALLHVVYLSPSIDGKFSLGSIHFINHQELAIEMLREKIQQYIVKYLNIQPGSLFVLDCSPGFSKFEQQLLRFCYAELNTKAEIFEEYITTLDSSHIKKCICCLNATQTAFEVYANHRNIRLTINDMQNYDGYLRSIAGTSNPMPVIDRKWSEIRKEIRDKLNNDDIELYRWKYSKEIALRTTFLNESKIENQVEDYIFTADNYKEMQA